MKYIIKAIAYLLLGLLYVNFILTSWLILTVWDLKPIDNFKWVIQVAEEERKKFMSRIMSLTLEEKLRIFDEYSYLLIIVFMILTYAGLYFIRDIYRFFHR